MSQMIQFRQKVLQRVMECRLQDPTKKVSFYNVFSHLHEILEKSAFEVFTTQQQMTQKNEIEDSKSMKRLGKRLMRYDMEHSLKLKSGELEPKTRLLSEMSDSGWNANYGPQLTRKFLIHFNLVDSVFPYDAESPKNFVVAFNPSSMEEETGSKENNMARGRILLPEELNCKEPSFKFHGNPREREKKYTIAMFDVDYMKTPSSPLQELCLYLRTDITAPTSDSPSALDANNGKLILPYLPPHPFRGSGIHRIIAVLLEQHNDVIDKLYLGNNVGEQEWGRDFTLKDLLHKSDDNGNGNFSLVGINFSRTLWTKQVSNICQKYDINERLFAIPIPKTPRGISYNTA